MNRKDYTRPTMKVVMLRHSGMLMTSVQGLGATREVYTHGRSDGGSGTDEEVWQ